MVCLLAIASSMHFARATYGSRRNSYGGMGSYGRGGYGNRNQWGKYVNNEQTRTQSSKDEIETD